MLTRPSSENLIYVALSRYSIAYQCTITHDNVYNQKSGMNSKYYVIGVPILLFFTLIMVNNNWRLGPLSGLSAADLESVHKKADFAEKVGKVT